MFGAHWVELLFIMVIALIVFGPGKLPEVGNAIGKGLREFRRATSELEDAVLNHPDPDAYSQPAYRYEEYDEPDVASPVGDDHVPHAVEPLDSHRDDEVGHHSAS